MKDPYNRTLLVPQPVLINGEEKWIIEKIVHKVQKRGKDKYKIKWEGFLFSENTFKDIKDIRTQVLNVVNWFKAQN